MNEKRNCESSSFFIAFSSYEGTGIPQKVNQTVRFQTIRQKG